MKQMRKLRQENERLMDLLTRLDRERAALERAHDTLAAGAAPVRPSPAEPPTVAACGGIGGDSGEEARLAQELAQERQQRQRAERDFEVGLSLMEHPGYSRVCRVCRSGALQGGRCARAGVRAATAATRRVRRRGRYRVLSTV